MRTFSPALVVPLFFVACNPSEPVTGSDGGDAAVVIDCPSPKSGPTMHSGQLASSETWSADASPHVITGDITVPAGKTLTIEPCATVQLTEGKYVYVHGTLLADGLANKPITIGQRDTGKRFASLWIEDPGNAELAYVTVSGGGGTINSTAGATIRVRGPATSASFKVDHVTVSDSAGYGVYMTDLASFAAGSQELTVKSSGMEDPTHPYPLSVNLQAIGTIPTGSYTTNGKDEIQIRGDAPRSMLDVDATLHDRGVPYHVGGGGANTQLVVANDMGLATLTIEPNVKIRFEKDGRFIVGHFANMDPPKGVLIAQGTPSAPIVFTSAADAPASGDWMGIMYTNSVATNNKLDNVHIEYAGGSCTCVIGCIPQNMTSDAAIILMNPPPDGMITNVTIAHSKMHGIDRAWQGAMTPSFLTAVTFDDIAGCHETVPRNVNNGCPNPVPCP